MVNFDLHPKSWTKQPKTEEDRLRLRILQLEAGGGLPKGVKKAQTSGRSQAAEVIQKLRTHYPLKALLGIAGLARSMFFARRQRT